MVSTAAPKQYPDELRERAIRLALDARRDPATRIGAFKRIGDQLGINTETLRNWVTRAEIVPRTREVPPAGDRPGSTTSDAQRLGELEREVRELRRANEMAVSRGQRNSSASFSDGVINCRVLRGRPLRESWIASSSSLVM